MGFQKLPPKIVNYQDYKSFDTEGFKNTIFCILNKHFHYKRKYLRANKVPFMIKELRKVMMKRPKLRNKFLEFKTFPDWKTFTSQRNCKSKNSYKSQLTNTKRTHFNNLDTSQ